MPIDYEKLAEEMARAIVQAEAEYYGEGAYKPLPLARDRLKAQAALAVLRPRLEAGEKLRKQLCFALAAMSWLKELKQPTEDHLKIWCEEGETQIKEALEAYDATEPKGKPDAR